MTYRVEMDPSPREGFGHYRYLIYRGRELVARYWHDYRGDEHGVEFIGGPSEPWPVGRMTDFLQGGGPDRFRLSERAIAYMDSKIRR